MAELNIRLPDRVRDGFQALFALQTSELEALFSSFESEKPTLLQKTLLKRMTEALASTPKDEVRDILGFLMSLYPARANTELSTEEFVKRLCASIDEDVLPADNRQTAESLLIRILNNKGLAVTAKANAVRMKHQRIFTNARILTDIRPIFSDESELPIAATIIHTLQLTYHENREAQTFFVAMDELDVAKLRKVIDRAEAKANTLGKLLETANLTRLTDES